MKGSDAVADKLTEKDYDIIYSCAVMGGMSTEMVKQVSGRAEQCIRAITRMTRFAQERNWLEFEGIFRRSYISYKVAKPWLARRLGIEVPEDVEKRILNGPRYTGHGRPVPPATVEEKEPDKPDQPDQPDKPDMTGEYLMRLLSQQTAIASMLKSLLEAVKSYGPAVLTDLQRIEAAQDRMKKTTETMVTNAACVLQEAAHDAGKELSADLKDNINANADIIRQELNVIKNNSRKRGL